MENPTEIMQHYWITRESRNKSKSEFQTMWKGKEPVIPKYTKSLNSDIYNFNQEFIILNSFSRKEDKQ